MAVTIGLPALATSEPDLETPIPVDIIEGLDWSLQRQLIDGELTELPNGVIVTLSMTDGTATGNGGCNDYFASYERDGDTLAFGGIGATEMYCVDAHEVEAAYFANLEAVVSGFSTGGSLVMDGADANPILEFAPVEVESGPVDVEPIPSDGIEGLTWRLDTLAAVGTSDLVLVPAEVVATITLEDGTAFGSGGCNGYSAAHELDGAALAFGPVRSTWKGCPDPIVELEHAFFAQLASVDGWDSDGGSVTFLDADGAEVARFVPATEA